MDSSNRTLAIVVAVLLLLVGGLLLLPKVQEQLAPEPVTAWVAIEPEGAGVATVGAMQLPVGSQFRLHAVLEAEDRQGTPVYYTEAPSLRIEGRDIGAESLRQWNRPWQARVRWFTVEGSRRYQPVASDEDLQSLRYEELLRASWPVTWTVPGVITSARDRLLADRRSQPFGTLRYHVRIELYDHEDALKPALRLSSWGAEDIQQQARDFPSMSLLLPAPLAPVSRVFGLTQVAPAAEPPPTLLPRIAELAAQGQIFSRATVLHDLLSEAGRTLQDLSWDWLELNGEAQWEQELSAGDLVRVGDRIVVVYEDQGEPGVVDYEDLCFDFEKGAAVRSLGQVFSGDGQAVEVARLRPPADSAAL